MTNNNYELTKKAPISDQEWWDMVEIDNFKRRGDFMTPEQKILHELIINTNVYSPKKGAILEATYEGVSNKQEHLFSYPGYKDFIRIENRPIENKYLKDTAIGQRTNIMVTKVIENVNYEIVGSIASIYETIAHQELLELKEDAVVIARVRFLGPAGYEMDILHDNVVLPGFMPNTLAGINKLSDPESIIGKEFEVLIETYSDTEGTYIVSRRRYLQTLVEEDINKLLTNTLYQGSVTGTTTFGVFVEFNSDSDPKKPECLTGLIHKVNIVDEWQDKFQSIAPGTRIEFYVKEIIKGNKIILTQSLKETLWDTIHPNNTLIGLVKEVKHFGILVTLDSETIGLIHSSEVEKLNKKFYDGEEIMVKVLAVDRSNRKIFLTAI